MNKKVVRKILKRLQISYKNPCLQYDPYTNTIDIKAQHYDYTFFKHRALTFIEFCILRSYIKKAHPGGNLYVTGVQL